MPTSRPAPAPARSSLGRDSWHGFQRGHSQSWSGVGDLGGIRMFVLVTEAPRPGRLQARWAQVSARGARVASSKRVLAEGAEGGNPGGPPREGQSGQGPQQRPWSSEGVQEGRGRRAQVGLRPSLSGLLNPRGSVGHRCRGQTLQGGHLTAGWLFVGAAPVRKRPLCVGSSLLTVWWPL